MPEEELIYLDEDELFNLNEDLNCRASDRRGGKVGEEEEEEEEDRDTPILIMLASLTRRSISTIPSGTLSRR